jgi:hypothetical protein
VRLLVRLPDADPDLARSLHGWLRDDPAVRPLEARPVGPRDPEAMGGVPDVVEFVVPNVLAAAQLLLAVAAWRSTRRAPPPVLVVREQVVVVVDRDDVDAAAAAATLAAEPGPE